MLVDVQMEGVLRCGPVARSSLPSSSPHHTKPPSISERLSDPIRSILSRAAQIQGAVGCEQSDDYAGFARDILNAGEHLGRVVADLGKPRRRSELHPPALLDILPIIDEALSEIRPAAAARRIAIDMQTDVPDTAIIALADRKRLHQILANLLSNAVKFSPVDSAVHVTVEQGDMLRISVSDEGAGIDPANRERVFDRFERLGRTEQGSGLGLVIARRYAEELGGTLSVEASRHGGATFTLALRPV